MDTELSARTYRNYGLATVRYPVLKVGGNVEAFENGGDFAKDRLTHSAWRDFNGRSLSCTMITKRLSAFLAVIFSLAIYTKTFAAVSPLASPFIGNAIETWEEFPIGIAPGPLTIFNGAATMSGVNPVIWRTVTSPEQLWGLHLGSYTAKAFDGTNGFSASGQGATARIDFQSPVTDFGAYWASATDWGYTAPIELKFLNAQGLSIGEVSFTYSRPGNNGTMEWQGWHSSEAVFSITYKGAWAAIDSLRVTIVPEPRVGLACLAFLATSFVGRRLFRDPK